ncbi:MAG: homocysteine methyltransferase [Ruminococcaceae bacterium]|nr:homocysteine methyltransferase [Oscillospiraceae bacterium]
MKILDYAKNNILYLDGGMGTLLQERGLEAGELPELWNLSHPDIIRDIHESYFSAGSNVVCANTFGANPLKFSECELEAVISSALENARAAREISKGSHEKFIALDIGPCGKLLKPYGDLAFEDAVALFSKVVILGVKHGAELVFIETMNDSYETKAALLAAKETCDLPVFVSNAYGSDGKLMTGATPEAMCAMLEGLGADAIGANCSLGPSQLAPIIDRLLTVASVPVFVKANAGLPSVKDGKTVFDVSAEEFSKVTADMLSRGARMAGGCCGTTPEYISALVCASKGIAPISVTDKGLTVISSYANAVTFGKAPVLIGERINPTGKKRFKQALVEGDMDYILSEALREEECGVPVLDVNVGIPDIDEREVLVSAVREIQSVCALPLQIDTSNATAMEAALRIYNGKAMINSVNGKEESMRAVFPLAKKYGGVIVALTLDENGIPETAEERFRIAENILAVASEYGIKKKDIIFDTLTMTVSADKNAAKVTLDALSLISERLGCKTVLGVSNVSFGLPARDMINSTFFTSALERGLSAAIMNPYSQEMMKVYYSYRALHGLDESFSDYIAFSESYSMTTQVAASVQKADVKYASALEEAVVKGLKERASELVVEMLKGNAPLDIVQGHIIPALDIVGKGFEEKTIYLPQLLMSAEAAKSAFEEIKVAMLSKSGEEKTDGARFKVIIATVKGDIHDIGKNIVKLLLENYGFTVIDLGRDVPPETIVERAIAEDVSLVGLSALMTTTVPAMEETIALLREKHPKCKVIVGGAVLNREYAERIGADKYAKDAMEAVRYAEGRAGTRSTLS